MTDDVVETYEKLKISESNKNIQEENISIVNTEIPTTNETVKSKKKRVKKYQKKGNDKDEEQDDDEEEGNKDKINKYKSLFDFSGKEITNSRFQDNESAFRIIKNWSEKEWNQT